MINQNKDMAARTHKGFGGKWLGHIAAIITVVMWGVSFVSTSVLLSAGLGPVEIYIYRFTIAYLCVLAISHKHFRSHSWRDEGLFVLCGVLGGSVYFIAENTALQYTTPSNVSLLTSVSPLITVMLMGMLYRNERPAKGMYIGSAIALVGVACVIFNSSTSLEVHPLGDILSLFAAFSWAAYGLILRRLTTNYDAWVITRKTFFYGVITALPFLIFSPHPVNLQAFSQSEVIINILFLALGASLVGYLLWSVCTRELGAIAANNYMYFQSVITMLAAVLILGQGLTVMGVTGCALIIGGLWVGDKLSKR